MGKETPDSERPLVLDIQSGACHYGLQWLVNGVDWLPERRIGTLVATDCLEYQEPDRQYCLEHFGEGEAVQVLKRLVREIINYPYSFPKDLSPAAVTWCFRSLSAPAWPEVLNYRPVGDNILDCLKQDGVFMTRILCEKILTGEQLPRFGKREELWLRYIFGDDWENKFAVESSRELRPDQLGLHSFSRIEKFPSAVEIVLRKCA
ncbi:MAG: hypothetical protein V1936_00120 [Patescibacteria group bacterium]